VCGRPGPTKNAFCSSARSPVGGTPFDGSPNGSPGTSKFTSSAFSVVSIEVGSCPQRMGCKHDGAASSGGGFGCGAHEIGFPPPGTRFRTNDVGVAGIRVLVPPDETSICFLPSIAQRFPPPDWHPNGAGPLSKLVSSGWPSIRS